MAQTDAAQRTLMKRLAAPQVAPPWTFGDIAVTGVVLALAMIIIAPAIALLPNQEITVPEPSALLFGWIVGLIIVMAFVMIRWRRTEELFNGLKLSSSRRPLFIVLLVGIGAAFTSDLLAGAIAGGFAPVAPLRGITPSGSELTLALFFALIAQPIAESVVFGGVVLPRLRASLSSWGGIWATAVLFGGFHLLVYGAQLTTTQQLIGYGFVQPFIIGFVLAAMRVDGDSTQAAIVGYMGVGLSSLLVLFIL